MTYRSNNADVDGRPLAEEHSYKQLPRRGRQAFPPFSEAPHLFARIYSHGLLVDISPGISFISDPDFAFEL